MGPSYWAGPIPYISYNPTHCLQFGHSFLKGRFGALQGQHRWSLTMPLQEVHQGTHE